MKAARVYEKGMIIIEDVPKPELGKDDLLVKVHRVGICGTDVGVKNGYVPAIFPVTLGHEFSGTIEKLGSTSLGGFEEGDRVTGRSTWPCGTCELCDKGLGILCENKRDLGRTADGCFAEFMRVNHRVVYQMPDNVSFDEAQNFINIACAVRAYKKVPLQLGKTVAVFGPGNTGLILLQLLKLAGAYQTVMVGTRDFRLEMAKRFGANYVVNIKREDPVDKILGWYPDGVDVVAEVTGNAGVLQTCCEVVKEGGAILSLGIFSGKAKEFDPSFLYFKEPVIYGSKGAAGAEKEAIQLLEEKRLQITPMITHRFPLEETAEGFKVFEEKIENALRIVIEPFA